MSWSTRFYVVAGPKFWERRAEVKRQARYAIDAMQQPFGDIIQVPSIKGLGQ